MSPRTITIIALDTTNIGRDRDSIMQHPRPNLADIQQKLGRPGHSQSQNGQGHIHWEPEPGQTRTLWGYGLSVTTMQTILTPIRWRSRRSVCLWVRPTGTSFRYWYPRKWSYNVHQDPLVSAHFLAWKSLKMGSQQHHQGLYTIRCLSNNHSPITRTK